MLPQITNMISWVTQSFETKTEDPAKEESTKDSVVEAQLEDEEHIKHFIGDPWEGHCMGDPWEGFEDIATEDLDEWMRDFAGKAAAARYWKKNKTGLTASPRSCDIVPKNPRRLSLTSLSTASSLDSLSGTISSATSSTRSSYDPSTTASITDESTSAESEVGGLMSKDVPNQHEDDCKSLNNDSEISSDAGSIELADGGRPSDTVIIFDWDDTLLCTSALASQQWEPKQLKQLERTVDNILHAAMLQGETLIVTNGVESWVEQSASCYLPGLLPTLKRLRVVSARTKYEKIYPGDPIMWKCQTFKDILVERQGSFHSNVSSVNLVVIGDSDAEIQAAKDSFKLITNDSLVKMVKFIDSPSVAELLGQLRRVEQEFGQIVEEDQNIDISLEQHELPPHLYHLVTWARGWTFSGKKFTNNPRSTIWPLFS